MTEIRSHLERAVEIAGSQAKLGERCGVSQNAIWHAMKHGRITAELAAKIHDATDGRVSRSELRPDLWQEETAA